MSASDGEEKVSLEIEGLKGDGNGDGERERELTGKSASSPALGHSGQVVDSPLMRLGKSAGAGICCQKSEAVDIKSNPHGKTSRSWPR